MNSFFFFTIIMLVKYKKNQQNDHPNKLNSSAGILKFNSNGRYVISMLKDYLISFFVYMYGR